MTNQELFDKVANHLLTQGIPSMRDLPDESGHIRQRCAYRGDNGTKCAVGCLIPDDQYDPNMETLPVKTLLKVQPNALGFQPTPEQINVLADLQTLHDICPSSQWPTLLKEWAQENHDIDLDLREQDVDTWSDDYAIIDYCLVSMNDSPYFDESLMVADFREKVKEFLPKKFELRTQRQKDDDVPVGTLVLRFWTSEIELYRILPKRAFEE